MASFYKLCVLMEVIKTLSVFPSPNQQAFETKG